MLRLKNAALLGCLAAAAVPTCHAQQVATPPATQRTYQANRVPAGSQEVTTVEEAIIGKLIKANDAEIELAKMAKDKSDNQEIKKLAEMIMKDHKALNEQLTSVMKENDTPTPGQPEMVVPQQLCDLAEQACKNSLEMTKEMLSQTEGQDFSMAYLAQQVVAHTNMLAELKAIQSTGPDDLKSIAGKAADKIKKHLEETKKLAKKLEDKEKSGQQS